MSATDPIAWTGIENAHTYWVRQATGLPGPDVRLQTARSKGGARGPGPSALVSMLSLTPVSQQGRTVIPNITEQRLTVIAGAGEVGIDFYPARSFDAQRISVAAGGGDPPAVTAAALAAELTANLPTGYSAAVDPGDTSSVILGGSAAEPLFSSAAAVPALLAVATTVPRWPYFVYVLATMVWRIQFRTPAVNGNGLAASLMSQAMTYRRSLLDPELRKLGFTHAGTPATLTAVTSDRDESTAVLDVASRGWMTGAVAAVAMRRAGLILYAAAA